MQESRYDRGPGYAQHYRDDRFRIGTGAATDIRERQALAALLKQATFTASPWLDAPWGAGRLCDELPGSSVLVYRRSSSQEVVEAGLQVVATQALNRFIGEQTLVLCRRVTT